MDLELQGVRVERESRVVLDVPSLRVRGGRTTAILGPNGSGKTTLLRIIAGLEPAGAGTIRAGGEPVRARRHLAYVFQEQVFLRQSVRANLELGLRLRGVLRNPWDPFSYRGNILRRRARGFHEDAGPSLRGAPRPLPPWQDPRAPLQR